VRPRCNRHGVVEKVFGGAEIECYRQTDNSCCRSKDAKAEKCDDGTLDPDVNLDVPQERDGTSLRSDQLLDILQWGVMALHQSTEPVGEDGDCRQSEAEAGNVALRFTGPAFHSLPIHLYRRAMEELVNGCGRHDEKHHGHDDPDQNLISSSLFCNTQ
jgi:hypothetical protein